METWEVCRRTDLRENLMILSNRAKYLTINVHYKGEYGGEKLWLSTNPKDGRLSKHNQKLIDTLIEIHEEELKPLDEKWNEALKNKKKSYSKEELYDKYEDMVFQLDPFM